MRYSAFISYNYRDRPFAAWIHRKLETYRIPRRVQTTSGLIGSAGGRLAPVFLDRAELASSPDLSAAVLEALDQAETLVVICSPNAAKSRWVNEEIRAFRALGRQSRIQCLIVGGEPLASRKPGFDPDLECFPPALFEAGDGEPLAADLRPGKDGRQAAKLKLIAGILGVGYAKLRDREVERNQRRFASVAIASLIGFVLMAGLAIFAFRQRGQAIAERDVARQKTITAERTVDFVESMFEVSDPSESKGKSITAREVLDRGARRIAQSLNNEPDVKTELTTTLSEVYGTLGLLTQSDALIRGTFQIAGRDPRLAARQYMVLGESQIRLGDYAKAETSLRKALEISRNPDFREKELQSRILVGLSDAQAGNNDFGAAQRSAEQAIQIERQERSASGHALALEALAEIYFSNRELDKAQPLYERAIALRTSDEGNLHPKVTEDLNMLGSIAYLRNRPVEAEHYFKQVLANDSIVLGSEHPDTAITMNDVGRVLLEQRKFVEAHNYLERAVAIMLRERTETHDEFAFQYDNLGIVEHNLNDDAHAEAHFRKALVAATMHNHRNRAPIMVDLADLLCGRRQFHEADSLLTQARPLMAQTFPDDPWRVAWADHVRGQCLMNEGRREEGAALIQSSSKPLLARWPAASLYGHIVAARLAESTAPRRIG